MRIRNKSLSCIFLFSMIAASLFILMPSAIAIPLSDFEEITTERGFGSGLNKYSWSSTTFNDDIYIGTFNVNLDIEALPEYISQLGNAPNPDLAQLDAFRRIWSGSPITPSDGAEIWRYDGTDWKQVYKASPEDVGFREMTEYNGYIYAGSANGPNGPEPGKLTYSSPPLAPGPEGYTVDYLTPEVAGTALIRSADGVTWEEVNGGPGDNVFNSSNRTMVEIDGELWLGTENILGPEVWSWDGTNWTRRDTQPIGGLAVGEIAEYNKQVYLGGWGGALLQKIDKSTGALTNLTPNLTGINDNEGVMQLFEYKGFFYLGTVNYEDGFTLLRTSNPDDPDSWQEITRDGFESEGFPGGTHYNAYSWSTQIIDGVLYMGTFNTNTENSWIDQIVGSDIPLDGRGQLWYSEDGLNWKILEDNGFDSKFTYGFRTMTTYNGNLVIGTASNLFFPDFFSMPYADYTFDMFSMILDEMGLEMSLEEAGALYAKFGEFGLEYNDFLPYIGTQVFMSKPVSEPAKVTPLVTFIPDPSTFAFDPDPADCQTAAVGKFSFDAKLTNISEKTLSNLHVEVDELTNDNLLLTDNGLIGEGERFEVPKFDDYTDGILSHEEMVDVPFTVCLKNINPFRFFVNVLGVAK
jgi:hypothetical protein